MYLWLIIATFIAALFAMSTSLRPDINELYVEPQAQNVITKMYVQHRAARKMLLNHRSDGPGSRPSYGPGEVTVGGTNVAPKYNLSGYVPYGFNQESGVTRFTTLVYCLDERSEGVSKLPSQCVSPDASEDEDEEGGTSGTPPAVSNCCAAQGARTYVITFGCVPMKWKDVRTGRPTATLLNSMKTTTGFTNGLGYVIPRSEIDLPATDSGVVGLETIKTTMGIMGQGQKYYIPIPQYIIDSQLKGVGNRSFNKVCGSKRTPQNYQPEDAEGHDEVKFYESCDYCLVYMTPF